MEILKKKSRKTVLAGFSTLISIACNPVLAGNRPLAVTVTVAEGYYVFDNKWGVQNNGLTNIGLAFDFTKKWAIEGNAGVSFTRTNGENDNFNVLANLYTLDALYRITSYLQYEPYLSFGVGLLTLDSTPDRASSQTPNINVALGSQYFFSKSIAMRLELKDLYSPSQAKNDFLVSFGMSFVLGGCTNLSAPTNAEKTNHYKRYLASCVN